MKHKAFTLVEFIVIMSIFAIMAAVAMYNFTGFRSSIALNNLAHDIGLTIRQAQVFGWVTTTAETGGLISLDANGNPVRYADGVFFPKSNNKQFILYKKTTPTVQNFVTGSDIVVDTITISGPNRIVGAFYSSTNKDALKIVNGTIPSGVTEVINDLSVSFTRPRPETTFHDGLSLIPANFLGIYVVAETNTTPRAANHVIIISQTGEIDVQ